jgi:hypothetical protein
MFTTYSQLPLPMLLTSSYYRDVFGTPAMRSIFSDDRRFTSWLETAESP